MLMITVTSNPKKGEGFPFLKLLLWSLWALRVLASGNTEKSIILDLAAISLPAWIVGLVSPNYVLRFGLPKTRLAVTLIYLTPVLIYILFR